MGERAVTPCAPATYLHARVHVSVHACGPWAQDASKTRETRLRKAGIQGRARVAGVLREMDDRVTELSTRLAVRSGDNVLLFGGGRTMSTEPVMQGEGRGRDVLQCVRKCVHECARANVYIS
jgi:hypothetical protein